jgi:hypothetical protein
MVLLLSEEKIKEMNKLNKSDFEKQIKKYTD